MSETAARSNTADELARSAARPTPTSRRRRRSATPTSCSPLRRSPNGGSPRQRRKTGRSEISERQHDRRRRCSPVAAQPELDHLARHRRGRPARKQRTDSSTSSPSRLVGRAARAAIVRDGWRSAMPSSVRSAASSHCGGTQAMCVITLVRWFGCRGSAGRGRAHARELAARSPRSRRSRRCQVSSDDRRQCRRQDRPSRWTSSSADGGPHVPAA